jgi:uncharacterized YccA/Bax inhibitor family protein
MTVRGAVEKTAILFLCLLATAGFTWFKFLQAGTPEAVAPWMMGGAIGGLVVAILTVFNKQWAPVTAPLYAALEGLFIGGISSLMEAQFPGIVIQAAGATFAVMAVMLFLYESQWIVVTQKLRLGIVAATGGIALFYLVSFVLSLFGVPMTILWSSGPFGILFSLVVVGIAALNLVLDFDVIEQGARAGAPKYMEWYCAFGLMVTLVWLYLEILRLLAKTRSNR